MFWLHRKAGGNFHTSKLLKLEQETQLVPASLHNRNIILTHTESHYRCRQYVPLQRHNKPKICPSFDHIFNTPSSSSSSSSYFTGFYNPLSGFNLLILEVSRSHTLTHCSQ